MLDGIECFWYNVPMSNTPNKQSKSVLSRLLASENVTVIHDHNARTASFDVRNRVLTLPVLGSMSDELYDMIVGHEVGHALFTPYTNEDEESIKKGKPLAAAVKIGGDEGATIAMGYLNVVEDARIERMMKEKFGGLRRDFYIGYKELDDMDFFETRNVDINTMGFIDRINLHYKVGTYRHNYISFSDEEMEFINMIDATKTFDDVVTVTQKIWDYCKKQKEKNPSKSKVEVDMNATMSGGQIKGEVQPTEMQSQEKTATDHNGNDYGNEGILPEHCKTQLSLDNHLIKMNGKSDEKYFYTSIPKLTHNVAVDYKKVLNFYANYDTRHANAYKSGDNDAKNFIKKSKMAVNILVKQFMMKKAASESMRGSVHKTGVIDPVRMMNFHFTDDIFLRQKVVKKGKSHGLVFFMDWSGSMAVCFEDTLKQLFQIVLFCRHMNIPFEVYAFTSRLSDLTDTSLWEYQENSQGNKYGFHNFSLLNILSSRMSSIEFNNMLRNLFVQINVYSRRSNDGSYCIPAHMELSSTPLNETVVAAMKIVPLFKEQNKLDIVHTVFLTDGETSGSCIGASNNNYKSNIIVNNKTYLVKERTSSTDALYEAFRDITGCRSIGFFIDPRKRGGISQITKNRFFINGMCKKSVEDAYDKEGFTVADRTLHGHDELFIVRGNYQIDDEDLDEVLSSKKSTTGIRNAFIKTMDNRTTSRVMLNRFIDLIAVE